MIAGALEIQLFAGMARLRADMTAARGIVQQASNDMGRAVGQLKSALGTLGIGLGIRYFYGLVRDAIGAQDELAKLSQKVNTTVETLVGLQHAAELSGTDLGSLTKGLKGVTSMAFDAASGLAEARRNFALAGVTVTDTSGKLKTSEQLLLELSDAFQVMGNTSERTALAVKIFGKAGLDMIPMLAGGSAALKEMIAEGQRLNPVTAQSAANAEAFNDNMLRLWKTFTAFSTSMLNSVLPVLADIAGVMAEDRLAGDINKASTAVEEAGPKWTVFGEVLKTIIIFGANVSFVFQALGREVGGIAAQIVSLAKGDFAGFSAIGEALREDGRKAREELDAFEQKILGAGTTAAVAKPMVAGFVKAIEDAGKAAKVTKQNFDLMDEQVIAYWKNVIALASAANAAVEKEMEAEEKLIAAKEEAARAFRLTVENAEYEVELLGKSNTERQVAIALHKLEAAGFDLTSESVKKYAQRMRDALNSVADFNAQKGQWDGFVDGIEGAFRAGFDHIGKGWKSLVGGMASAFQRTLMDFVYQSLAKPLVMNLVLALAGAVGATGLTAAANAAAGVGGSAAGNFGSSLAGSAFLSTGFGEGLQMGWMSGVAAPGAGFGEVIGAGMSEMWAGISEVLSYIPVWGWIAAAVVAIGAWISAGRSGGPKLGGSFIGNFDSSGGYAGAGVDPSSDNGRLFTPNQADAALQDTVVQFARGFYSTLARLGGSGSALSFGVGFDSDPEGSAANRVSGIIADASGVIFRSVMEAGRDDEDLQRAFGLTLSRMTLAGLQRSDLPAGIAAILSSVSAATGTQEEIQKIIALALAFSDLMNVVSAPFTVEGVIAFASRSPSEVLGDQSEALLNLARTSDFSVDSLNALTQATAAYRNSAAQLILTLESTKKQIDAMFGDTRRNIQLAGLDSQGQYNFYQADAERLFGQLGTAGSAEDVARIATAINADINAAFALLSPEQQASMQEEWLSRLDTVNTAADDRIVELQESAAAQATETLTQIKTVLDDAAAKFTGAAAKVADGGDSIERAANTPKRIDLTLHTDGSSTVSDGG